VKVASPLSTNDGGAALAWALDGQGILLRSLWNVEDALHSGLLRPVLPTWKLPPADIYLVHPTRSELSAKTRALSEFLCEWFAR
jgi:DNA-binding transcriptional LysR family regulator